MIRVLTMIAVAGFVLCVGSLAAAVAVGGPDALARGSWAFIDGGDWGWGSRHSYRHERDGRWSSDDDGKDTTRTLAWSGAEGLEVDLPADVRYIQSPGAGTVELAGPERALQDVEIHGNSISYRHRHHGRPRLEIIIRAPNIHAFDISGHNSLQIENYRQARLDVDVSGQGEVTAVGEADEVALDVSGDADVDLGKLKAKGADVEISGSGDTTIAPTERAKIKLSGMGDVRLLTQPKQLETDISGNGRIRQDHGTSPSPSRSPSPSPAAPKGKKT
jgi:hypothetical protein